MLALLRPRPLPVVFIIELVVDYFQVQLFGVEGAEDGFDGGDLAQFPQLGLEPPSALHVLLELVVLAVWIGRWVRKRTLLVKPSATSLETCARMTKARTQRMRRKNFMRNRPWQVTLVRNILIAPCMQSSTNYSEKMVIQACANSPTQKMLLTVGVNSMSLSERLMGLRASQSRTRRLLVTKMSMATRAREEMRGETLVQMEQLMVTMMVSLLLAKYSLFLDSLRARWSRLASLSWQNQACSLRCSCLDLRQLKKKMQEKRAMDTRKVMMILEYTQSSISLMQESAQQEVSLKGSRKRKKAGGTSSSPNRQKKVRVSTHWLSSSSVGGFCRRTSRRMMRSVASRASRSTMKKKMRQEMTWGREKPVVENECRGSVIASSSDLHPQNIAPITTSKVPIMIPQMAFFMPDTNPPSDSNSLSSSVTGLRMQGPRQVLRKILELLSSVQFMMNSFSSCSQKRRKTWKETAQMSVSAKVVQIQDCSWQTYSMTQRVTKGNTMLMKQPISLLLMRIQKAMLSPMQLRTVFAFRKKRDHYYSRLFPFMPPPPPPLPNFSQSSLRARNSKPIFFRQLILKLCLMVRQLSFIFSMFRNRSRSPLSLTTCGWQSRRLQSLSKKLMCLESISTNYWQTRGSSWNLYPCFLRICLLIWNTSRLFLTMAYIFSQPLLILHRLYWQMQAFSWLLMMFLFLYFSQSQRCCRSYMQSRKRYFSLSFTYSSSEIWVVSCRLFPTLKQRFIDFTCLLIPPSDLMSDRNLMGLLSLRKGSFMKKSMNEQSTSFLILYFLARFRKFSGLRVRNMKISLFPYSSQSRKALRLNPHTS